MADSVVKVPVPPGATPFVEIDNRLVANVAGEEGTANRQVVSVGGLVGETDVVQPIDTAPTGSEVGLPTRQVGSLFAVLVDAAAKALAVVTGQSLDSDQPAVLMAGSDGTDARILKTDSAGRLDVAVEVDSSGLAQETTLQTIATEATLGLVKTAVDAATTVLASIFARQGDGSQHTIIDNFSSATGLTDAELRASPVPVSDGHPDPQTDALTDAQLRASAVPVSAGSLPLPSGASTEATLAAIKAKTDNIDVALSTRSAIASTQPVSAASLPLPTGAATEASLVTRATEATLSALNTVLTAIRDTAGIKKITDPVTVEQSTAANLLATVTQGAAGAAAWLTDVSDRSGRLLGIVTGPLTDTELRASAVPVSGPATAVELAVELDEKFGDLGQALMVASAPVVIASDQSAVAGKNAAASQADGHSATLGTTADASTATTVIGRLQKIVALLAGGLPAALVAGRLDQNLGSWLGATTPTVGQKTMAASLPVALASDQGALTVTGGLTDAELRASAVPVSGPLTDAQLRAAAVPVSAATLPLPTGAATEATLALIKAKTDNIDVALSTRSAIASTQPVSAASLPLPTGAAQEHVTAASPHAARLTDGTSFYKATTPTDTQPVSGPLTDVQLRASAVPVSAASLPLPSGAATEATLATRASEATLALVQAKTDNIDVALSTRVADATITARLGPLGQAAMAASAPVVIASNQSEVASKNAAASQVDGHSASIGATTDASTATTVIGRLQKLVALLPTALVGGRLDTNLGSWLGATTPTVGQKTMAASLPVALASDQSALTVIQATAANLLATVTQGTAAALAGAWPVKVTDGVNSLPAGDAAARSIFTQLSDGSAAYVGAKTGQLPAALVGGRLDENVGAWLGSTTPTVGQKTMAASLPVTFASDQTAIAVTVTLERAASGAPVGVTVSTSAVSVLASNASARSRIVSNNGSTNVYLGKDNTVTATGATMGIKLLPGGTYSDSGDDLYTGAIFGIGDAIAASQNISAWERTA